MVSLTNNKPMPFNKNLGHDHYITSCTDCRWGIFSYVGVVWTKRGLVHQKCEDKRLVDEADRSKAALH